MLKRFPKRTGKLWLLLFVSASAIKLCAQEKGGALANEQIASYHSDITVNANSTLQVRETIAVVATYAPLQHEIYRDLPTIYRDRLGNDYAIHFEVVSVELDGQPNDYHLERLRDGLRIDMGKSHESLSPGTHSFQLTYTVNRELGFFSDHDELYWNVTGDGWAFPIQEASATIHLPRGIARAAFLLDAYTGLPGSAAGAYTALADDRSNVQFRTTQPLGPHEDLTIVVRWPKGFVNPPTDDQKYQYFLDDNQVTLVGVAGLLALAIYYTVVWFIVGRGSATSKIQPAGGPPRGFSPAAIRYVNRMAFDTKAMVANLVDLAVKKQLAILEDGSGAYILGRLKATPRPGIHRGDPESSLEITADERLVLKKLFAQGDTVRLAPSNHALVGGATEALHRTLRSTLEKIYLWTNSRYLIPGILISVLTIVRSGISIQGTQKYTVLVITGALVAWSLACAALGFAAVAAWRYALSDPHHKPTASKQATVRSLFFLLLFIGEIAGLWALIWAASAAVALILVGLVLINYLIYDLLKAPTRLGRGLLDGIEGFRLYLVSSQKDQGVAIRSPMSPQLFEKFLPYAMAMNVEKAWCEKFAAVLAETAKAGARGYAPVWYNGPNWNPLNAAGFATSLGTSFSSAISSACRALRSKSRGSRSGSPPSGG